MGQGRIRAQGAPPSLTAAFTQCTGTDWAQPCALEQRHVAPRWRPAGWEDQQAQPQWPQCRLSPTQGSGASRGAGQPHTPAPCRPPGSALRSLGSPRGHQGRPPESDATCTAGLGRLGSGEKPRLPRSSKALRGPHGHPAPSRGHTPAHGITQSVSLVTTLTTHPGPPALLTPTKHAPEQEPNMPRDTRAGTLHCH